MRVSDIIEHITAKGYAGVPQTDEYGFTDTQAFATMNVAFKVLEHKPQSPEEVVAIFDKMVQSDSTLVQPVAPTVDELINEGHI